MADKASNYATHKAMTREELGDSTKCVKIISKDKNGEKIKPVVEIDKEKMNEDLKYAGYNLMVTSELDMEPLQVYQTYHCLQKIEESFRITKSYLDARPVYVQKKETIYGHFLICYLSLFLLRVLEIKVFKNQVNSYDLINFIQDFRVVDKGDGSFIKVYRDVLFNRNKMECKKIFFASLMLCIPKRNCLTKQLADSFFFIGNVYVQLILRFSHFLRKLR